MTHTYAAGRFVATVTATSADGEQAQAQVAVTAVGRTADARDAAGGPATKRRSYSPDRCGRARRGAPIQIYRGRTYVTTARVGANGRFRTPLLLRSPGPYHARYGSLRSAARSIRVRPRSRRRSPRRSPSARSSCYAPASCPAAAGTLRTRVLRGQPAGRDGKGAGAAADSQRREAPRRGARSGHGAATASRGRVLSTSVVQPALCAGARGRACSRSSGASPSCTTRCAASTRPTATTRSRRCSPSRRCTGCRARAASSRGSGSGWQLRASRAPRAAATTSRSTRRARCSSTCATERSSGSCTSRPARPATRRSARGHVYRKVGGWDWVLWYPMYFLRGFAIHGYPSVPAYPASHGCVRIPMWLAPTLYSSHGYGTTVVRPLT